MKSRKLVPYTIIIAAKKGDPDAMHKILSHYDRFIDFHSQRTVYDEYGNPCTAVDPEIKHRIQAKIIDKIIHDFDPSHLPEGEVLEC